MRSTVSKVSSAKLRSKNSSITHSRIFIHVKITGKETVHSLSPLLTNLCQLAGNLSTITYVFFFPPSLTIVSASVGLDCLYF